jgi:ATP-dependent DNA helicase RecG
MPINDPGALLRRLLQEVGENPWLEFKQNNKDPDLIAKTLCACANGAMLADKDRAYIVWGIEDKSLKKIGTTVRLTTLTKGGESIENWLNRIIEPRLMMEFHDFLDEDGKRYALIGIEPTYDKPVKYAGTAYIRIGQNVKRLGEFPDHERALWLATSRHKFEDAIALSHQSDEAILEKLDISAYYQLTGNEQPKKQSEILRRFAKLGYLRDDMEGGYDITNLGAILFARDLTAFPSVAAKSMRVIKYTGNDKRRSEEETEGKRGYAVGFRGMLKFIMERLPKHEVYKGGVRRPTSKYSETAIREIIANALIHQDFAVSGAGPVVEIYDDRTEVTNPGNSLIEVDRIIDERRSRNQKFAAAMREMGICEERGGGIDKAIIEIEEMNLPAPEFFTSADAMRVVLFGPKKFNELSKSDRVWACFCHCVVRWIRHDYMSNTSLRERFSLEDEQYQAVSSVISDARKAKRIVAAESDQGKRNARYVPYWVQ